MYQRRYDKAYLMLRQETSGYSIGNRTPWGSCTMEIKNSKGQLRLQVQGLMPLHQKTYTVYALAEKEKECHAIYCGQLPIDKHGTGTLTWDFLADDLDSIYQVEDLFALTILTESNGKVVAPLVAYFGTPRKWLSRLHLPQITEQTDLIAAEAPVRPTACPILTETAPFQTAMSKPASPAPKAEKEENHPTSYHGNFRGLLQKFRQEMQELTEMGILSEEESSRILGHNCTQTAKLSTNASTKEDMSYSTTTTEPEQTTSNEEAKQTEVPETLSDSEPEPMVSQEIEIDTEPVVFSQETPTHTEPEVPLPQPQNNLQSEQEQTRARATALQNCTPEHTPPRPKDTFFAALKILHSRPAMIPFHDQCTWRCITLQDLVLFPSVPLAWQKDPFLLLTMAKYGHLLLRREGSYFLLGVPDTYASENTNSVAQFGLTTFQKLNPNQPEGYWLGVLPQ